MCFLRSGVYARLGLLALAIACECWIPGPWQSPCLPVQSALEVHGRICSQISPTTMWLCAPLPPTVVVVSMGTAPFAGPTASPRLGSPLRGMAPSLPWDSTGTFKRHQ